VNYSVWLLTTTSWIAAGQYSQYAPAPAPQQTVISSSPISEDARPGFRERLRHLFRRDEAPAQPMTRPAPRTSTTEPPLLRPTPQPQPALAPAPAPAPAAAAPAAKPGVKIVGSDAVPEVGKKFQEKVGCAPDHSWITGQLFYVHTDGGRWVLRYTSVGEQDKYGGSVVIAPGVDMKNYREGDLVSVNGKVLSDARTSHHLPGALYQATSISLIERADP
jgi:hypothetical protein